MKNKRPVPGKMLPEKFRSVDEMLAKDGESKKVRRAVRKMKDL